MSSERDALTVTSLSHHYTSQKALIDVTFNVAVGNLFTLLGPNGSGKTTLFRIISTLLPTRTGHVQILGYDVTDQAADVRRLIGVLFQSPALDIRLTVQENLSCQGHLYGLRGQKLKSRLHDVLSLVELEDRAHQQVGILSGGLQRRVELAKALLPEPRVLILDEPSTGLDPGTRHDIWNHLETLRKERGTTVILTTHLIDEVARADKVAVLNKGKLVALGAPQDLVASIGSEVLVITSSNLNALATEIRNRFHQPVKILDDHLRIERPRAHEFISTLVEAFPNQIETIKFGKPTLEDVFLYHTGQRWH